MQKIVHYFRRVTTLGLQETATQLHLRFIKKQFGRSWRKKASNRTANHTWDIIAANHNLSNEFAPFWTTIQKNNFVDHIYHSAEFIASLPDWLKKKETLIALADSSVNHCFDLLGSGEKCFSSSSIAWQADFKWQHLSNSPYQKPLWHLKRSQAHTALFYQDIAITFPKDLAPCEYYPDIKVPWELSRLQHLFILGCAYQYAAKAKRKQYVQTFVVHVQDWVEHNPFLLGANWVCPMEVAIRSINLIWACYFFQHEKAISLSFWKTVVCSLYDHAIYLEHNWEKTPKPNNHYLANHIGYYYLTNFFDALPRFQKKRDECFQELEREFDRQLLPDGASYEGSTAYHYLVTEIFLHFYLLACQTIAPYRCKQLQKRLQAMQAFLSNCSDSTGNLIQIGDNDSGKLVCGLKPSKHNELISAQQGVKHYPYFGLSIIKDTNVHLTFRHPTYAKRQPTGHFHLDQLAITLCYKGIPVLIDPGSYLYTANSFWRNRMRSFACHNTFYLGNHKTLESELFELPRPVQLNTMHVTKDANTISIKNYYSLKKDTRAWRNLVYDKNQHSITIIDWWQYVQQAKEISHWSLLFHPCIFLRKIEKKTWHIIHKKRTLMQFTSNLSFKEEEGFYSQGYGKKESCIVLIASATTDETTENSPAFMKFSHGK